MDYNWHYNVGYQQFVNQHGGSTVAAAQGYYPTASGWLSPIQDPTEKEVNSQSQVNDL